MPKKKQKTNQVKKSPYPLLVIPAILFVLIFVLTLVNDYFKTQIVLNTTRSVPFTVNLSEYPVFRGGAVPFISAKGIVIMDGNHKRIIYEKNKDFRFSPASTTKIVTALTALEYYDPNTVFTVSGESLPDSVLGIKRGDKFIFEDLLYAMMLPSDNLAAETFATNHPQGRDGFTDLMNSNLERWNLKRTHFADASGLDDDGNYSTPYDLAVLASLAMQNPTFAKIVGTREWKIRELTSGKFYPLDNLNRLLDFDNVVGVKTGHTDLAGDVLVTAKRYDKHLLIMVVMNSEDRFSDTLGLLDFVRNKINYLTIRP